jgi:hypothetical protein
MAPIHYLGGRGLVLLAQGFVRIDAGAPRNVGWNQNRPARTWEVEGMRPLCYALVALCFMIFPAARVMADEALPIKVVEEPIMLVGKTAAASMLEVVSFLNVSIGVPVACIAQGIADQSSSGCSVGAGKALDESELALCESGRLAIDAWTFGCVTWPPCQQSS